MAGTSVSTPITLGSLITEGETLFSYNNLYYGHGTLDAWDEAVYLLSHALNLGPATEQDVLTATVSEADAGKIRALFKRRVTERIPAAYLTSEAWFCGLSFYVDERVIIPRSPISQLILDQFKPWLTTTPRRILDLCAGSGCIGISCAYAFPDAQVTLTDISADALEVAAVNRRAHGLEAQIDICQSDLFGELENQCFDLIVSNPPYVSAPEYLSMPAEYRHEPELALRSGHDGLAFTRRLLAQAHQFLHADGLLAVEVGNSAETLQNMFPSVPFMWVEFSEGDGGVFVLSQAQLQENCHFFL